MSDDYDEIDELMDWEEMDRELEVGKHLTKTTGCCLLPCLSMIAVVVLFVGILAFIV